jgi:hypothetical protein
MRTGEFSVVQFFRDGSHEYVRRWITAGEAVHTARDYTRSVDTKCGFVAKVIITDGGDHTVFEWRYGEGITFAPEEKGWT